MLCGNHFEIFSSKEAHHSLVVWVEPCKILSSFHEKIQSIQSCLGLTPDENAFISHITIAQLLNIKPENLLSYLSSPGNFSFSPFEINHLVLLLLPPTMSNGPYIVKER